MPRVENGCTQPQCLLRSGEADTLAELIVRALAGQDPIPESSRIEPLDRCVECVRRVMGGRGPIETVEELLRGEEAGRWTWRRSRRGDFQRRHEVHSRRR